MVGVLVTFLVLWGFASLRWKTGTDWDSYYDTFFYFSDEYRNYFEPGFIVIVSTIRSLTSNYSIFLLVFSFLCLSLKYVFFYKFNREIIFTLIFLFYCYYFGDIFAVRQNLAISITLLSTWFIIKRQPYLFVIIVLLASSIHFTSILYLIAYYLYWTKISNKTFLVLILVSIVFGFVGGGGLILEFLLKVFGVGGYVGEKITQYVTGEGVAINTNNDPILIYTLGLIKRCLLIPIFMYVKVKSKDDYPYLKGFFNLYMVGNLIYFLFAKDMAIFARMSVPFLFFEIFLLAYFIKFSTSISKKGMLFAFLIVLILAVSRFNALVNSYYDLYVPYNSIFDRRIDRSLE